MNETVVFESVTKVFRHRPSSFHWLGRERSGETYALLAVSLTLAEGEVVVLLGPNGAGKTTLLKLVSTVYLPNEGRVLVCGLESDKDAQQVRSRVAFAVATERSFYPRLTALENLDFFAGLENIARHERAARIERVLEATGLTKAGDTLAMKFSTGMYQRLGIARALLKEPAVLLLDEPTRSLDPAAARQLWLLVRRMADAGCTVILATHNFDEAIQLGTSVAILRGGRLAAHRTLTAGTPVDELRSFYFSQLEGLGESAEPTLRGAS